MIQSNRLLLVEEAKGPYSKRWGLPKGFVESGELPSNAAIRELEEECGITGEVVGIISMRERVKQNRTGLFISYLVEPKSIDITLNSNEISDFGWFSREDLESVVWVSSAMQSISEVALTHCTTMGLTDYSTIKNEPYLLHLAPFES